MLQKCSQVRQSTTDRHLQSRPCELVKRVLASLDGNAIERPSIYRRAGLEIKHSVQGLQTQ